MPIPGRKTISKPVWSNYQLQIPWGWMTNDTGPITVQIVYNPANTTIYDVVLQGDARCDPGSNYLDIYFNDQKVAPLHWGGSEGGKTMYFNPTVAALIHSGSNSINARGGKDFVYPSTVTFTINAALIIQYSGTTPTVLENTALLMENPIVM